MKLLLPPANATFNFTAKTITFATTIPSTISHILHVTNVTRGVIYFQPQAGSAYTGTYASPVLTLLCSTSGHADTDKLEIFYDDGLATTKVIQGTGSNPWGQATAATNGTTTTLVNIASSVAGYEIKGMVAHGTGDGYFFITVAGTTVLSTRTRATSPVSFIQLLNGISVTTGSVVALKVTNESGSTADYDGSLLGV